MISKRITTPTNITTSARKAEPRYKADITAGALKVAESRIIADLLLRNLDEKQWKKVILTDNILQTHNPATATRLTRLIRGRLETMDEKLWRLVRDGNSVIATQAIFAAALKQSRLLGDFLDLVVREQLRVFMPVLSNKLWEAYLLECRGRDPEMPEWNSSTKNRLRSSVFQILAQVGYIDNTRTLKLQSVFIAPQVLHYLQEHQEDYVLRCIQIGV